MTTSNIRQFNREMDEFVTTLAPALVASFIAKVSFELLYRIVQKTPIDTGRARGAWQMTVVEVNEEEFLGGDGLQNAMGVLPAIKGSSIVYLSNNVPYIIYLEKGSSKQAPEGMIEPSLSEVRQIFP